VISEQDMSVFSDTAFHSAGIEPLPESLANRTKVGDELQPFGSYANANPYHGSIQDVDAVQDHEPNDPELKDEDWWWDNQRIRFWNGKIGLKFLILFLPFTWILSLVIGCLALVGWSIVQLTELYELPAFLYVLLLCTLAPGWLLFSFWVIPPTTNWLMSTGIGFFLKPFEKR